MTTRRGHSLCYFIEERLSSSSANLRPIYQTKAVFEQFFYILFGIGVRKLFITKRKVGGAMSGFKTFPFTLYVLASAFVFLALVTALVYSPWTHQAANLFTKPYIHSTLGNIAAISILSLGVV